MATGGPHGTPTGRTGPTAPLVAPWIALSDHDAPPCNLTDPAGRPVAEGSLVIELALPLPEGVLLDVQTGGETACALSLFHAAETGLTLMHRQGTTLTRHLLAAPLRTEGRTARLICLWNGPERVWSLRLETRHAAIATAWGRNALPLAGVVPLFHGAEVLRRDPCILWYGLAAGEAPPPSAPWIGLAAPIPTADGPVPAGRLTPGARIVTRDGLRSLRTIRRMTLPARGFLAPVVLRAPFLTRTTDLLVSAAQPILLRGPEVEYLFGEDEVLVEAGHLADGRAAVIEARRPTVTCVSLDLGHPALIEVDGCTLLGAHHAPTPARNPLRLLLGYEAMPLVALLKRLRPAEAA